MKHKILKRLKNLYKFLRTKNIIRYQSFAAKKQTIFVLGNQKSGTTAIGALLSKATGKSVTLDLVRAIDEYSWQLNIKYKLETFESFAQRYSKEFSSEIIKAPSLTFFYEDLIKLFPNSKFVYIARNPFDNIRSILNRLKIPGNESNLNYELYSELERVPSWKLVLNSGWLGQQGDDYIESLAYRWNIATQIYLNNKEKFDLIKYETFKNDKVFQIDKLAATLGLEVKYDISDSINKQYQSKGNNSENILDFFGEENFETINKICSETAKEIGYDF